MAPLIEFFNNNLYNGTYCNTQSVYYNLFIESPPYRGCLDCEWEVFQYKINYRCLCFEVDIKKTYSTEFYDHMVGPRVSWFVDWAGRLVSCVVGNLQQPVVERGQCRNAITVQVKAMDYTIQLISSVKKLWWTTPGWVTQFKAILTFNISQQGRS